MSSTISTCRSVRSRSRSFMMRTTPLVRVAEPYDDTAMKSNSTGQVDRAREVGHEHERALEDADEQRRVIVVVGRDLLAEVADALLQLVLVDDDPTDVRVVHVGCGLRAQPEEAPGTGGDPDAMVDTVTDDPDRLVRRPADRRRPGRARRLAATPASASASCRSFEPLRPSGRNRSPAPAARTTTDAGHPVGVAHRPVDAVGPRHRRAVLDPRLDLDAARTGPGPGSASDDAATAAAPRRRGAVDAHEPAAHPLDPVAAGELRGAARRPRATASTRSTVAADGGGGRASQRRTTRRARARRGSATSAARRRDRAAAASDSSSSSSSRNSSAWRASTSTRSRSAPRSSRGMTSRRSQTRRWCRSSFIGSCTGASPSRAQSSWVSRRRSSSSGRRTKPRARRHARQPGRRRAPQHLQQHRLGLVVARVPDEDRHRRRPRPARVPARRTARSRARASRFGPCPTSTRSTRDRARRTAPRPRAHRRARRARCPARRPWSTYTACTSSPCVAREREQRERVGAAAAPDDDRARRARGRRATAERFTPVRRRPEPATRPGSLSSATVGRFSGACHTASNACRPPIS